MSDPVAETRAWLEKTVIGLNLCPFAREPFNSGRIRFVLSQARNTDDLREELVSELDLLSKTPAKEIETTLLIHPFVLGDFLEYNDFLDIADEALGDLEGVLQIASFHPCYQFEGTEPDAPENGTNRSPYPMLHILREESVERAAASYPDVDAIPERNIETMRRLAREKK